MTSLTSAPARHRTAPSAAAGVATAWEEPAGVSARGTLVVLTGRGESAAAYQRFGRRISVDAYRVRVVETDLDDLDRTREEVVAVLAADDSPAPRVLVGSDAGASLAALLAGELDAVDAVVLAGPVFADGGAAPRDWAPRDWEDELEARTVCPAHRRVLTEDPRFERGDLGRELPAEWSVPSVPAVPTLVLHGSDDPVTARDRVQQAYGAAATVVSVEGGRHDVLNDVSHRSVAATIVLFLERLRLGADLPTIVRPVAP